MAGKPWWLALVGLVLSAVVRVCSQVSHILVDQEVGLGTGWTTASRSALNDPCPVSSYLQSLKTVLAVQHCDGDLIFKL